MEHMSADRSLQQDEKNAGSLLGHLLPAVVAKCVCHMVCISHKGL
jgi:hypothetical protein